MQSFSHVAPELRVHAGDKALARLGRELDRAGARRAVLFTGRTLADSALIGRISDALGERCVGRFSGVRAHTPLPAVEAAAEELGRLEADAVIAIGGGSAIVTGRAAAICLCEDAPLNELATRMDDDGKLQSPRLNKPKPAQFVVPTTPTTAMVKAGTAVHDPESAERLALFDPKTRACALFLDPELLLSAPPGLARDSALDTLALAIEGLVSDAKDPIADSFLMHAIRLLDADLGALDSADDDADVRARLVSAAIMCGRGTDQTGAGMATVLGHAIGAVHELPNGTVKATVLPHVLRFNGEHLSERTVAALATALGVATGGGSNRLEAVIEHLEALYDRIGVPPRLRDMDLPHEALATASQRGMGDWFLRGNPRRINSADELHEVLDRAW